MPGANKVTLVGLGDDGLPALLAAAADTRFRAVAIAGYFHSFISQMKARLPAPGQGMGSGWNDPQISGRVDDGTGPVDFGCVIPGALQTADVPDIAALISPRRLLFCQAREQFFPPEMAALESRFRGVVDRSGGSISYAPGRPLTGGGLLAWLKSVK